MGILGVFSYAFAYMPAAPVSVQLPEFKNYQSKKLEIGFDYPKILKVWEKEGIITIEHKVSFKHREPCNGSGLPPYQKAKEIFDFFAQITVLPLTPTEVFRQAVMERDTDGDLTGIKNTVRVTFGSLDGFRLYNGSHGCGPYSYFFQLSDQKVLKVDRYPASEFKEVPEREKEMYSRLRQIILPEQEEHFFREILTSLK